MKNGKRNLHVEDDEFQLHAEIVAIASMTADEVNAELRRLGLEPVKVLPRELKRLLKAEPSRGVRSCEPSRTTSAATAVASFFAQFMAQPAPTRVTTLLSFVLLFLCVYNPTPINGNPRPIDPGVIFTLTESRGARFYISENGSDDNPCSRTAPCKSLTKVISLASEGDYIGVIHLSKPQIVSYLKL